MTHRKQLTLAYAFIAGTLVGSLAGSLLVPRVLPVEYLTPVFVWATFAGCVAGAVIVRFGKDAADSTLQSD
jgi:hypothetical protein